MTDTKKDGGGLVASVEEWLREPDYAGDGWSTSEWLSRKPSGAALSADRANHLETIARLREALAFYAKSGDYIAPLTGGRGKLYFDCGQVARAALSEGSQL